MRKSTFYMLNKKNNKKYAKIKIAEGKKYGRKILYVYNQ